MKNRMAVVMGLLWGTLLWGGESASAQGRFGFGVVVGEPTGIAWKYRMDGTHSLAGIVGVLPSDHLRINVDVLWHSYFRGNADFAVHYGPGIFVGSGHRNLYRIPGGQVVAIDDEATVGFRMAVGVTYTIPRSPVDLFFEIAPAIVIASPAGAVLDYGLGVRVYP